MGELKELGITNETNKTEELFEMLLGNFWGVGYSKPSEYVSKYWNAYKKNSRNNNSRNGKIFEYILATLCVREGVLPFYMSAKVTFVPNAIFDLMFYSKEVGPICISAKTSLRERYKQAALEGLALKNVHRNALSYLVTLDEKESINVRKKIDRGDIIGLEKVVVATTEEFDELIDKLKTYDFSEPTKVNVIETNFIITKKTAVH